MRKYFWAQYFMAKESGASDLQEQYMHMALAKKITIPKRPFIEDSPRLVENITDKIVRDLTKILNGQLWELTQFTKQLNSS